MSTPEISSAKIIQSRYSPFSSGINKSLLTPCRQVGLSRKRKTSMGNLSKHSSEDLNHTYSENETTPLTHTKFSNRKRRFDNLSPACDATSRSSPSVSENRLKRDSEELKEHVDVKKIKRGLLETFASEDLFDSNDDMSCSSKKNELSEVAHCSNINECISDVEIINEEDKVLSTQIFENRNRNEVRKTSVQSSSYFIDTQQNYLHNSNIQNVKNVGSDSDDDFISKSSKNLQKNVKDKELKSVKKILSQKTLSENKFSECNSANELKIQLEKLSEMDIVSIGNNSFDDVKTINEKSSSDADFFTSTPEEEKLKRKNYEKKIKTLESEVKRKRSFLENLERSSIYKGKHNIQDLQQLSSVWLEGCGQALKDLLTHLQAHSSIDLNTLLNNMRIPEEIVAKLSLDCN